MAWIECSGGGGAAGRGGVVAFGLPAGRAGVVDRSSQEDRMPLRLTREEFHRWAEGRRGRYERVAGEPVAMSPERAQHVRLKSRVWSVLDRAIREAGLDCEALADGMTVEVDADTDYEPDALVNCGPRLHPDATAATNPVIVVEVLSPSTQSVDSSEKLADYFRVLSIQHYLIVRARRQEIIHHWRAGDEIVSRTVNVGLMRLDPPGIAIDVEEVYGVAVAQVSHEHAAVGSGIDSF
jgi:Uma2 family endonuclease